MKAALFVRVSRKVQSYQQQVSELTEYARFSNQNSESY
jgi:DNA invertase Pin-like site-specific DNA recombinase